MNQSQNISRDEVSYIKSFIEEAFKIFPVTIHSLKMT